ncbi:MAG TPA: hypothetical protein VHE30_29700 [Polyangiaceae bacterium]|nr:hypothetical protein [Polyangiaceae bacterium]
MKTLTRLGCFAAIIAWFSACDSGGSSTDGNTTWLELCGDTSVCGPGLTCSCGVCTKPCAAEGDCTSFGPGAACVTPALLGHACASSSAPSGPVCMRVCVGPADCSAGLSCVAGFCAPPSHADGGPGTGGASAGSGGKGSSGGGASGGAAGGESAGGSGAGGAHPDAGADAATGGVAGAGGSSGDGGGSAADGSADASTTDVTSPDGGPLDATAIPAEGDAGRAVVTRVAAAPFHACAVVNGGVQCWGRNDTKQLGNAAVGGYSTLPVPVTGLDCDVTDVCGGLNHTCALANGHVRCWGDNSHMQLGTSSVTGPTTEPVTVPGLSQIEAIACGKNHTCALRAGGVTCWGDDAYDQLGQPGGAPTGPTGPIGLPPGATAIYANGNDSCALVNGGLYCWGDDTWGQLGNGVSGVSAFVPYQAPELSSGVTAVAVGDGEFICASVNGAVLCSGRTLYDVDAQDFTTHHTFTAVSQPFDTNVQLLSGGNEFTCAGRSGAAYCFGVGQVAHFSAGPNILGLETGVTAVTTGDYYACVLKDGQVWCWGWDMDGQLGRGQIGAGGYAAPVVGLVARPSCTYGHCLDHELSDGETSIDCGGACPACRLGQTCAVDGDCQSSSCDSDSHTCISNSCNDHHQDNNETDSDCGGGICGQCLDGRKCAANSDCINGFCGQHVCQ